MTFFRVALIALVMAATTSWAAGQEPAQALLSETGQKRQQRHADQLEQLRTEIKAKAPSEDQADAKGGKWINTARIDGTVARLKRSVLYDYSTPTLNGSEVICDALWGALDEGNDEV